MATRPEGFWWFQKGEYNEEKVEEDIRDRLPRWYADRGYIDFQVLGTRWSPTASRGKAMLKLTVDEGQAYKVGDVRDPGQPALLDRGAAGFYPFAGIKPGRTGRRPFSRSEWEAATEKVSNLYANNGYIYARVEPDETRRTGADGSPTGPRAGPFAKDRRPRSTRSRSWATTSPTSG